jgi:hypothetical protein
LMQIMDALEQVGGTPISRRDLHAFAYFSNVLSPLWEVEPVEGSVLKERTGPYFPSLQREIDACVGNGLLLVEAIGPLADISGEARIDASFRLDTLRSKTLIDKISALPDETAVGGFLLELAFAFLEIAADRRDDATLWDAAWSDPSIADDRVVDFAEWVSSTYQNPTWNAAQRFQEFAPKGVTLSRAEKLLMYMRLMKRRAHG